MTSCSCNLGLSLVLDQGRGTETREEVSRKPELGINMLNKCVRLAEERGRHRPVPRSPISRSESNAASHAKVRSARTPSLVFFLLVPELNAAPRCRSPMTADHALCLAFATVCEASVLCCQQRRPHCHEANVSRNKDYAPLLVASSSKGVSTAFAGRCT